MLSSTFLATLSAILVLHTTTQAIFLKASKDGYCPAAPQPLNNSIIDAWETTKKIQTMVMFRYGIKQNTCNEMLSPLTNNERGVEVVKTVETLKCYMSGGDFKKADMVLINHVIMSISEIVSHPQVCLDDADIARVSCFKDVDITDFKALYKTIQKQRILLEGLLMGTYV